MHSLEPFNVVPVVVDKCAIISKEAEGPPPEENKAEVSIPFAYLGQVSM